MTKKNSFTLLEMMIALAILSLIGAVTAVNVKKLIDSHRFESEVSLLYAALQDAQVLSSAYRTDISLDIVRKNGRITYRFSSPEPFKTFQLDQRPTPLTHTTQFAFNQSKQPLHIDIRSGRIEPAGILSFTQSEDTKTLWFDLQRGRIISYCTRQPPTLKHSLPARPKEA